jgi:hypothetical protein
MLIFISILNIWALPQGSSFPLYLIVFKEKTIRMPFQSLTQTNFHNKQVQKKTIKKVTTFKIAFLKYIILILFNRV